MSGGTPFLFDYQKAAVHKVREILHSNYLRERPAVRVLDAGCDPTGRQLWHLSTLFSGEVIGVNTLPGFPSPEAVSLQLPNGHLLQMDAMNLAFPDEWFDLVLSSNVLEHVADPGRYLSECHRVLKRRGLAYFETYPLWTGPRGHHVFEDMVQVACPGAGRYRNDGSIIPDWGHLVYDETSMREIVAPHVTPQECEYILRIIYKYPGLNRQPWRTIRCHFERLFPEMSLFTYGVEEADVALKPVGPDEDYGVAGFSIVARKAPSSRFDRFCRLHLFWRMKQLAMLPSAVLRGSAPRLHPDFFGHSGISRWLRGKQS